MGLFDAFRKKKSADKGAQAAPAQAPSVQTPPAQTPHEQTPAEQIPFAQTPVEQMPAEQAPIERAANEMSDVECNHEWIAVPGEWTEKCTLCGMAEPAKFRQRGAGELFPMVCVSDVDMDAILVALQFKYMARSAIDGTQNEWRILHGKLESDREYMLNKDEANSIFLSLTTYGSTSPAACPPMFAGLLDAEKQQYVKDFLFGKWMDVMYS